MQKLILIQEFIEKYPLISFTVAIISIIVTVIIGYITIKKKKIGIVFKSNNLINHFVSNYGGLQIKIGNEICSDVTVTKIAIWNKGRETINSSDIVKNDKIFVKTINKTIKILSAEIIKQTNNENINDFKITMMGDFVKFNFDYIDKNEGMVVQIMHTGSDSCDLLLSGTLKGIGKLQKIRSNFDKSILILGMFKIDLVDSFIKKIYKDIDVMHSTRRYVRLITCLMLFFFPFLILIPTNFPIEASDNSDKINYIFAGIAAFLYWPFAISLYRQRIPKQLDVL